MGRTEREMGSHWAIIRLRNAFFFFLFLMTQKFWILAHRFFIIYFQYFYQRYVFVLGLCSLLLSKSSSGALSRIRGRVRLSPSPHSLPPPWASFPLRTEQQAKPSKLHPAPGASKCGWESLREQQVRGLKSCSVHRHSRRGVGVRKAREILWRGRDARSHAPEPSAPRARTRPPRFAHVSSTRPEEKAGQLTHRT